MAWTLLSLAILGSQTRGGILHALCQELSSLWMRRRNSKAWQTLFMSMGLQEELSPQCHQAAVAAAEHQAAVAAAEQMDSAEKEANDEDLSGI